MAFTPLYVCSSAVDGFYRAVDDCCGCCCCILDTDGFMFYYSASGSCNLP